MKYLYNTWTRGFISIIGAGMLSEIINIATGAANHPLAQFTFYYAIAIFMLLTVFLWVKTYYDAEPPDDYCVFRSYWFFVNLGGVHQHPLSQ